MLQLRVFLVLSAWVAVAVLADRSARDKIALHKAWLMKHQAHLKAQSTEPGAESSPSSIAHIAYLKSLARRRTEVISNEVLDRNDWPTTTTTTMATTSTTTTTTTTPTTPAPSAIAVTTTPSAPNTTTASSRHVALVAPSRRKHPHHALRKPNHPYWGGWERWSQCSRSCGGGVTTQTRHCYVRLNATNGDQSVQRQPSALCIGVQKRHRVCNEESCPDPDEDFRQAQCSQYNNVTFEGKQYEWEAYVKDDAECELNCKPVAMDYFALLDAHVADGTPCTQPVDAFRKRHGRRGAAAQTTTTDATRRAICVAGVCKTVHSGGLIAATLMNEGTVRCGMLLCRPVSGVFSDNPLQEGYTLVATIPMGSSNISITELMHSTNRLAIRAVGEPFVINGDESDPSSSGLFDVAEAFFDYRQIGPDDADEPQRHHAHHQRHHQNTPTVTEWITSTGPISQPIEVMVMAFDRNPGIKFEYLVPTVATTEHLPPTSDEYSYESFETESNSVQSLKSSIPTRPSPTTTTTTTTVAPITQRPRRKRHFAWKIVGFEQCSRQCGGGIQLPTIRCVLENPLRIFVPKKCAHLTRPDPVEHKIRCNTHACPSYWKVGEWGSCDCTTSRAAPVVQQREVKCVQELSAGMLIQIPDAVCTTTAQRPDVEQNCPPCPKPTKPTRVPMVGDDYRVLNNNNRPLRRPRPHHNHDDGKDRGVWLSSAWSGECSNECQTAGSTGDRRPFEHRTIFCDRINKFTKRCELTRTPETIRQCAAPVQCTHGEWLTGGWAPCGGDCFNLTQTRTVACARDGQMVGGEHCKEGERPLATRPCAADDVAHCQPQWHYSEWSECTKPCAGGNQRRTIKCVRPIGMAMKESDACKIVNRLPIFQSCNEQACPTENNAGDNETAPADLIQNDTDPECVDKLSTCQMVHKEHLCGLAYFQAECCYTCSRQSSTPKRL